MIFLILVSCKNKAISASCPQQKFHSSSRFSSLFLSSLGSFSILFLRAKLGECVGLWFALTPPSLTWLTEQKNPLKVCKHAARYNEFGYKSDKELSKIPATYKPRKTVQKAHYIPRRDELSYVGLVLVCAINLAKEKTDNFHLAICRRRSFNYNYVLQDLLSCSNYVLLFRHSS